MNLLRPRSIFQLTVIGYLVVVAPLIAALFIIEQQLKSLSQYSETAISEAAQAMRASRALIESIDAMERNARQYAVLGDSVLVDVYANRRETFQASINTLEKLELGGDVSTLAPRLRETEQRLFHALTRPAEQGAPAPDFSPLLDLSQQTSRRVSDRINTRIRMLRRKSDEAMLLLRTEAVILVSTSLLLAGIFTAFITRPLHQLDRAIRKLGRESFDDAIRVEGPHDLQELGIRLDWLRNRLRELEQQRTRFLQHVSHELKTPLTAVQEGTALLSEGVVGPLSKQQNEIIGILRDNCRRLQNLIENLLRFRLNSSRGVGCMPGPVRLDIMIDHVVQAQSLALKACRVELVQEDFNKVTVYGDEEQLRVIVDNVLGNAIKYSPQGGKIYIRLEESGQSGLLAIRDEGEGIPPEERERVFEAFYQGKTSDRGYTRGTGLGLAIAAEYAHMNGGSIEIVDSSRGAHFQVHLPLAKEDA